MAKADPERKEAVFIRPKHDQFTLEKEWAWLRKGILGAGVNEEGACLLIAVFICKKISG